MLSESPPLITIKRAPSSTASESSLPDNPPFFNHATLYFEDGSVIIMPNDSTTIFCVHRSLVSAHSAVLREMCIQAERTSQELFRGRLLIRMPDAFDDLETLFNIMYDGIRLPLQAEAAGFPYISSAFRMATKYGLAGERAIIIENMPPQWGIFPPTDRHFRSRWYTEPHPADIISLLRECDYSPVDLLEALYYKLSILTFPSTESIIEDHFRHLSQTDIDNFTVSCIRLRTEYTSSISYPPHTINDCPNVHCQLTLLGFWTQVAVPHLLARPNMARPVEAWFELESMLERVCAVRRPGQDQGAACVDCKSALGAYIALNGHTMKAAVRTCFFASA
ncbi:hypothetical protein HWV62_41551 [Athelia sp. TMB]|nr:hypothetical protein HWV62_41551 [Athelia sp. TMB]